MLMIMGNKTIESMIFASSLGIKKKATTKIIRRNTSTITVEILLNLSKEVVNVIIDLRCLSLWRKCNLFPSIKNQVDDKNYKLLSLRT